MLAIELRFLSGRYHATPWGRQVNEGAIEWPPSPWRLLRAIIATWHSKHPNVDETVARSLIEPLTGLPSYALPPYVSEAHTRHFMPAVGGRTTKIFDAFATLPKDEPLCVLWPNLDLSADQTELLGALLRSMNYLGRSESWVEACLLRHAAPVPNTVPVDVASELGSGETVRLLAANNPMDHLHWRDAALQRESARRLNEKIAAAHAKGKPTDKIKLSKSDLSKLESQFPTSVFEALHAGTPELRNAGWNYPPGSRWVEYLRPPDTFARTPGRPKLLGRQATNLPTVARFAVSSAVRPLLTESLWIGERMRTSLMSRSGGGDAEVSPVFSGKHADGSRLDNGHQHAHYICEANGRDGCITHITVFAPMGFDVAEERTLSSLRRLWGREGHDLHMVLLGVGRPEDFAPDVIRRLNSIAGHAPIMANSRTWISRTPFVPTRFLKARNGNIVDELIAQVQLEISRRDWLRDHAETVSVEPLLSKDQNGTFLGGHFTRWLKFRRQRRKGNGRRAGTLGYGFRLIFQEPIRGPIALGYACHFGLGQFVPPDAHLSGRA